MTSPVDQLRTTLDNLSEADFKRFRNMLDERSKIPWRNLEKADTEDVLRLMTKEYGSVEKCGVAMVNILRTMNHNHLATELEEYLQKNHGMAEDSKPASHITGAVFFSKHKGALEKRLGNLSSILIALEDCGVISSAEREDVDSNRTPQQRNHALLRMLENKGEQAQEKFYQALKMHDRYLVEDLMSAVDILSH